MLNIPKSKHKVEGESLTNPDKIGHKRRAIVAELKTYNVKQAEEIFQSYADAADKSKSLKQRIGSFLRAESTSGRRAKIVKDFALLFFPWGTKVSSATEMLREVVLPDLETQQHEPNPETMKIVKWLRNRLKEPSTQSALVIIAASATFFGLSIDVIELQAAIDAFLTAASGVIAAGAVLYELFRKERPDDEEE